MRTSRRAAAVLVAVACGLAPIGLMPSCSDDPTLHPCTGIPTGGCPLSKGVACEDPLCEAVYACRTGNVWELDHACPPHEAGVVRDAAVPDGSREASRPFDASVDAPPGASGGPGCAPLQAPDCTLGFALACPAGCCGCEDLFVCQSGGWSYWATCSL